MNFSALFACYAGRDIAKSSHTLIDAEEERHHPKHEADAEGPLHTNSERCNRARPQIASCEPYCKSSLLVTGTTLTASTSSVFLADAMLLAKVLEPLQQYHHLHRSL